MEFSKAKQEFQIRYFLWAGSEWEKEINESFPNLRQFKSGAIWKTYHFMRLLNKSEQLLLSRGLLKRFHSDAVKILGEGCSPEEETFRRMRDSFFDIRQHFQFAQQMKNEGQLDVAEFWIQRLRREGANVPGVTVFDDDKSLLSQLELIFKPITTFEEEITVRKKSGEKIKFIGKKKLQKIMEEKFRNTFGDLCLDYRFDDALDPWSSFDMKCCGWILSTHFWFGRSASLINYHHNISSPTKIHHEHYPEITAPALMLAQMISISSWLGLTSQIQWEYLFNEEVDAACDAVIKHCQHFFEVAPKLLKGLEFEKITAN